MISQSLHYCKMQCDYVRGSRIASELFYWTIWPVSMEHTLENTAVTGLLIMFKYQNGQSTLIVY